MGALVTLASGAGLLWAVLKLKHEQSEEVKPLLDPELPTAIVHQYNDRKNAEKEQGT